MSDNRKLPLLAIDLTGGSAVACCLLALVWLITVRSDDVSADITQLRQSVQTASQDLAAFRSARDRQQAILTNREAQLSQMGHLPDRTPIERYFQTLSALASQHNLTVRRNQPVSPRRYPGLLEQRYSYELSGAMPDITQFFRSVEHTDYWADISYLKVESGHSSWGGIFGDRIASLTISLFSALPIDPVPDNG
ncbi:MAG: hypothetical protein JSU63_22005 [Phycisphaerales bacterium]|nr:MAG: hypothetical protein JSU63_22005 [Phycisphaerales bacterium]